MEVHIQACETHQCKAIFSDSINANSSLFGGKAMQWMDEVAYITATRYTREKMFTVKTKDIKFLKAIPLHSIIELVGKIKSCNGVSLEIKVEIYVEKMYEEGEKEKAIEGIFIFAALNDKNKPMRKKKTFNNQEA